VESPSIAAAALWHRALIFDLVKNVNVHPLVINRIWEQFDFLVVGSTLATNLLSTGLIAWKAWQRRIPVKENLRGGSGCVRVDRVFALLIESGLIYGCLWVVFWILTTCFSVDPTFTATAMAFVSGLYPTLIIILVSKQMSPIEQYSTDFTDSIDSEMPVLGPPMDSGLSRHVLKIRRDSTNDSVTSSVTQMKPPEE